MKIFKDKKLKITFEKVWQDYDSLTRSWKEVNDSYIIAIVNELKKKYEFEVSDISLNGSFRNMILIKCKKSDRYNIFSDFCIALNGKIEKVKSNLN